MNTAIKSAIERQANHILSKNSNLWQETHEDMLLALEAAGVKSWKNHFEPVHKNFQNPTRDQIKALFQPKLKRLADRGRKVRAILAKLINE